MRAFINILTCYKYGLIVLFFLFNLSTNNVLADNVLLESNIKNEIGIGSINILSFPTTLENNSLNFQNISRDTIKEFKRLALEYANTNDAEKSSQYIEKVIQSTLNTSFIDNEAFYAISDSVEYKALSKKYKLNFSLLNLFYLFSSLIGLFIAVVLNFKRTTNESSNLLISSFVLIHSFFIFHIFLYLSNLKYNYPHILFMSIIFSFLYGPLIYFYFKKLTQQYKFRRVDLYHLIPTAIILIVFIPIYILPEEEKLKIMLKVGVIDTRPYLLYIYITKLFSLILYAYLVFNIFNKSVKDYSKDTIAAIKWKKSLVWLGLIYIVSYAIYGLIIIKVIPKYEFLYHLQVLAMATMVLYIGFIAYLKPKLLSNNFHQKHVNKYIKSGLTNSHSQELKEKLILLLEEEKIYRQNDINLETLSKMLGTTRHNASQIINEHFDLNFFELINKFRIEEALEILKNDTYNNLNIIDVAYEVGFNNKVTFNKSFKKHLSLTPTQYLVSLRM